MLLTLRSGPESLALTARQVPVYLMVVILHIPMPCLHGAASCRHTLWRTASIRTIYNSSPPDASPGHSAGSGTRHSPSAPGCHTRASWPPGHRSTTSDNADGRVETRPVLGKDLLEDTPIPRGCCTHRVAPSWGDMIVTVQRLYHDLPASSTPHRPVDDHPPPPLILDERELPGSGKCIFLYDGHRGADAVIESFTSVQILPPLAHKSFLLTPRNGKYSANPSQEVSRRTRHHHRVESGLMLDSRVLCDQ